MKTGTSCGSVRAFDGPVMFCVYDVFKVTACRLQATDQYHDPICSDWLTSPSASIPVDGVSKGVAKSWAKVLCSKNINSYGSILWWNINLVDYLWWFGLFFCIEARRELSIRKPSRSLLEIYEASIGWMCPTPLILTKESSHGNFNRRHWRWSPFRFVSFMGSKVHFLLICHSSSPKTKSMIEGCSTVVFGRVHIVVK